jgi:hypothetical protein
VSQTQEPLGKAVPCPLQVVMLPNWQLVPEYPVSQAQPLGVLVP